MLADISTITNARTGRVSSWDTTGRNQDRWTIPAGESRVLADIRGPGLLTHIWMTQRNHYRDCLLKITWDNADHPSVLAPLGDFFGLGNAIVNSYQSQLFTASTRWNNQFEAGCALNCYAPMPFRERALVEGYGPMLLDELNVKTITFHDASGGDDAGMASEALVEYVIKPNLPVLGPRLGKQVGALRRAMQELDPAVATGIAQAVEAGETIEIAGVELAPSDLLIELRERPGAATAQDARATVALTPTLTPALVQGGTAREVVHRLQSLRREAGFDIADRIVVWIDGGGEVAAAIGAHEDYVRGETLATELHFAAPHEGAHVAAEKLAGQRVRLGVRWA